MQDSNVTPRGYLKIWRWPFVIAFVGLVLNVGLSFLLEPSATPRMTGVFIKLRMKEFVEKISSVHKKEEKYIYFWGASEVESALDTRVVDKVLEDKKLNYKSVNAGMRSVHPASYRAFIQRVAYELESEGKKIDVSFVKLPLNKLTFAYRAHYLEADVADQVASVLMPSDFEFMWHNTYSYFSGMYLHYLFKDASLGIPSEMATEYLALGNPDQETRRLSAYFSIWLWRAFLEPQYWNAELRGSYEFNRRVSGQMFDKAILAKKQYNVRYGSYFYFEQCCGMSSLEFDPKSVQEFVESVEILKRVSKKVYIYVIPETAEFNLWRKNDYGKKTARILSSVSTRAGVEFINASGKVQLDDDKDFLDFLHLSKSGQAKFYDYLFDQAIWEQ